jgi:hypothetical protein
MYAGDAARPYGPSREEVMSRVIARWGFIPLVVGVVLAGVVVDRVIESIALAAIVFTVGTYVRRWVAA